MAAAAHYTEKSQKVAFKLYNIKLIYLTIDVFRLSEDFWSYFILKEIVFQDDIFLGSGGIMGA